MKYLTLFDNHNDYDDYIKEIVPQSTDSLLPNVSYCINEVESHFTDYKRNYEKEYFTIEALDDGNVYFKFHLDAPANVQKYMEYSKDNGETWNKTNNVDNEEVIMTIPMSTGETAIIRGENEGTCYDYYANCYFYSDIRVNVFGNIMSLVYSDNFYYEYSLPDDSDSFTSLFNEKIEEDVTQTDFLSVVDASNLVLPLNMKIFMYSFMFAYNTELQKAPKLSATVLTDYCYASMFQGCTSLTTAPELPATTLAYNCYQYMFRDCTSLKTPPELPATTLYTECYKDMFKECTGLTTAPELPATTLRENCYESMFEGCTSLEKAQSVLPSTELKKECYKSMLKGCTSLKKAPELPATTLAISCYESMFEGCTSLEKSPSVLPAEFVPGYGYKSMFKECTSLKHAPEILAKRITNNSMPYAFYNCSSLTYIKASPMNVEDLGVTGTIQWVYGVPKNGTFIKRAGSKWSLYADSGIPDKWKVFVDNV